MPRRLWYQGSQALVSSPKQVIGAGGRDLTLVGVEPKDAGLYVCVAVNPAGEAQLTTSLHVICKNLYICLLLNKLTTLDPCINNHLDK